MKVESIFPSYPAVEVKITLTLKEAQAVREALYLSYVSQWSSAADTLGLPIGEIIEIGNALYKQLTEALYAKQV